MTANNQDVVYRCPIPVVSEATALAKAGAIREERNYHAWNSFAPGWYCIKAKEAVAAGWSAARSHHDLVQTLLAAGQEELLASMFRTLGGSFPRSNRVLDPVVLLGLRAGMVEGPFPPSSRSGLSQKAKEALDQAGYKQERIQEEAAYAAALKDTGLTVR